MAGKGGWVRDVLKGGRVKSKNMDLLNDQTVDHFSSSYPIICLKVQLSPLIFLRHLIIVNKRYFNLLFSMSDVLLLLKVNSYRFSFTSIV